MTQYNLIDIVYEPEQQLIDIVYEPEQHVHHNDQADHHDVSLEYLAELISTHQVGVN